MIAPSPSTHSSSQPDLRLLTRMAIINRLLLALVVLIAGTVFLGWLIPPLGQMLPEGWSMMKVNSALCALLVVESLKLSQPKRTDRQLLDSRLVAGLIIVIAGSSLNQYLTGVVSVINTLIVPDAGSANPGLMSVQTSTYYTVFAFTLVVPRARKNKLAWLVDLLTFMLLVLTLVILAGYLFGAATLFGDSAFAHTSPQTLFCMCLLTTVRIGMRAEYGVFAVLVGIGIGSRIARAALPLAVVLPFVFVISGAFMMHLGWLSAPYSAAFTAAVTSLTLFLLALLMAWRINDLERDLRDMSLSDEMTRVYNRRGFQLLGEQALREARRGEVPLTVLYVDLDGLKKTNDSLGHDVGSQFVADVANLLRSTFRGSDIVARLGGDEFAVITHGPGFEAMARLRAATEARNASGARPYRISYSVGLAISTLRQDESLADVVGRADLAMYENKRIGKLEQSRS